MACQAHQPLFLLICNMQMIHLFSEIVISNKLFLLRRYCDSSRFGQALRVTSIKILLSYWAKRTSHHGLLLAFLGAKMICSLLDIWASLKAGRLSKRDWSPLLDYLERRLEEVEG